GTREHGLRVTVWMRLNSCEQGANRGFVVAGVEPHGMRGRRDGYRATLRKTSLGNHRGRGARLREDTGRRVRVVKEDADLRQVCSGDHASNLVSSNLLPRILDREHPRRWPWNRLTRRVSENDRNRHLIERRLDRAGDVRQGAIANLLERHRTERRHAVYGASNCERG